MAKTYMLIAFMLILFIAAAGCSSYFKASTKDEAALGEPSQKEGEAISSIGLEDNLETKLPDPVKDRISKMSLEEKIGQLVMVGLEGYTLDANTKGLIEKYKVGGFIIFGENVKDTNQLLSLLNSIRQENVKNKIPLFFSIDEEGGRVTRMPKEFRRFPTNRAVGQINNEAFSYNIGSIIAEEIKSFGFNMDLAPVLDVNTNPDNPVIGDRSFGSDAGVVSSLGVQTMKGIQSQKVIPVVKHFPGHGDTSIDSHKGLPTVNHDLNRFKSLELKPFAEAVNNNAEAVMIAHILLPKIDKESPASLSKAVITDILRKDLKFNGVVITDDMTMGAITKNY